MHMEQKKVLNNPIELTPRAFILGTLLAVIFAASNAYLGLKIGFIISVSIPAAVIAMVIFRLMGDVNLLEVNIVQTGASASGSLATDMVFILPALLLIGYWDDIKYWQSVIISIIGGILGILLSIPMRRTLLSQPELRYPEGVAVATMLQGATKRSSIRELIMGGIVGAGLQFAQQGFNLISSSWQVWFATSENIVGFSMGFDAAMFGAGYIIGFNVGMSIFLGALAGWVIGIPIISLFHPPSLSQAIDAQVMGLWSSYIRYVGVGALLAGGVWSLYLCSKPILAALKYSLETIKLLGTGNDKEIIRTERDLPGWAILSGIALLLLISIIYILDSFELQQFGFSTWLGSLFLVTTLIYILIAGFIFSAICAYFSGLVGMSASPVSSANIAIVILFSLIILLFLPHTIALASNKPMIFHAAGLAIIVATIVGAAASMANGTIQDLKTGEILGSTPWKLQFMLIIGTLASTFIVPPVLSILYHGYGIGSAFPPSLLHHEQALAAPQATIIATLTQGVFIGNLPYSMTGIGICLIVVLIVLKKIWYQPLLWFSILGFALAVYLPMFTTFPLIAGSMVSGLISYRQKKSNKRQEAIENFSGGNGEVKATLIATGLIAGGSLMGVLLAIPAALTGRSTLLQLIPDQYMLFAQILGLLSLIGLCLWVYTAGTGNHKAQ